MEHDALEKAKERLKSITEGAVGAARRAALPAGRAGSARGSARGPRRRHAPARPAPPDRDAPTLSPALKAQGWAVKQSRSTGGYYCVHAANGRGGRREPPVALVAPERRSSPERAAAALQR